MSKKISTLGLMTLSVLTFVQEEFVWKAGAKGEFSESLRTKSPSWP